MPTNQERKEFYEEIGKRKLLDWLKKKNEEYSKTPLIPTLELIIKDLEIEILTEELAHYENN